MVIVHKSDSVKVLYFLIDVNIGLNQIETEDIIMASNRTKKAENHNVFDKSVTEIGKTCTG